mmetsp:Transcript_24414/g.37844  ORF Transcript_24414/g.37844 Transcript_24414/m.37844 type:complete len:130 (-) Transcript_24414:43-432(-)
MVLDPILMEEEVEEMNLKTPHTAKHQDTINLKRGFIPLISEELLNDMNDMGSDQATESPATIESPAATNTTNPHNDSTLDLPNPSIEGNMNLSGMNVTNMISVLQQELNVTKTSQSKPFEAADISDIIT